MTSYVMDAEWKVADGADIVLDAEHLWCVVFKELGVDNYHTFTKDNMHKLPSFFDVNISHLTLIGHNILNADFEVFRRLLGIDFKVGRDSINGCPCTFIDTFTLSKRNNPDRTAEYIYNHKTKKKESLGIHGLDAWGKRVGIPKPKVTDWSTQPIEVYINRCTEDVKINELAYYAMLEERM